MNKLYTTLFLLLAAVPALAQTASDNTKVKEASVKLVDGTNEIKTFSAKHLKITFSDGKVHITENGKTESFSLANFGTLQLTIVPTGIAPLHQQAAWKIQGREVLVNAPEGAKVSLYHLNGQLVSTRQQGNAQFESLAGTLTPGIYVLRVNDKSTKIFVR